MRFKIFIFVVFIFLYVSVYKAQTPQVLVRGRVTETGKLPIQNVGVRASNTSFAAVTDKLGYFALSVPKKQAYKLIFSHPGYQNFIKEVRVNEQDTLEITIQLSFKVNPLDTISIVSTHEPETLVGKPNYSIYDFNFYEDKLLLLTAEKSLSQAQIKLADYQGRIFSSFSLPTKAGEAKHFFHDYEGYTDVICKDSIFRIDIWNDQFIVSTIHQPSFNKFLKPVSDTAGGNYYVNNNWDKYPSFNYYYLNSKDSLAHLLKTISNEDLLKIYNFEYYYLPSGKQLEARRLADYYKTDIHIIAALMSGFTQSLYYEPLYAPLFILKDTICIFNHYTDHLYHYNLNNQLIDSVKISYHHPKNWREWKRQLFVDETENKVYAFFSKDNRHYLKQIDHHTGKEVLTYKLKHHSAEKIKIKEGYVYYIYRPFGSTQERFLYREKIE